MANRKGGVGNGEHTGNKEQFFALCMGYHMAQEERFLSSLRPPRPYFHIDLNAGSGYNEEVRHAGTAITFMRAAARRKEMRIHATFVEKNRATFSRLCANMSGQFPTQFNRTLFGTHQIFEPVRGDNEEHLARFVQEVVPRHDRPEYARGSIISDPNGWSRYGGAVELGTLRAACAAVPNFLLLMFFPFGRARQCEVYKENGERGPIKNITTRNLRDFLSLRPHWLIAKHGAYVYLCGSKRRMPEGKPEAVPAYHHDSMLGREIIAHCSGERGQVA